MSSNWPNSTATVNINTAAVVCAPFANIANGSGALYNAAMSTVAGLNVLVMGTAVWALLWHTPPEMAAYRWHLLNIACTIFVLDMCNSLLYQPVFFQPPQHEDLLASAATGPLGKLGSVGAIIGSFLLTQLTAAALVAVMHAFVYRYATLCERFKWLTQKRCVVLLAAAQLLWMCPANAVLANSYAAYYDSSDERDQVLDACVPNAAVLRTSNRLFNAELTLFGGSPILVCAVLAHRTLRELNKLRALSSNIEATYKYHRQLFISLTLQLLIPFALLTFCYGTYSVISIFYPAAITFYSQFMMLASSLHTTVNGAVMLATVRPYREAIRQKWRVLVRNKLFGAHSAPAVRPIGGIILF